MTTRIKWDSHHGPARYAGPLDRLAGQPNQATPTKRKPPMTLTGEIIDTRDLIEREREILAELEDADQAEAFELRAELAEIRDIEGAGIPDYPYGEALIREDYFTEYAQQLAEDIGAIKQDGEWPHSYIDWDAAADALKVDYTEVEYQGHTYLARA